MLTEELRATPRQVRSADSVRRLLDAAERVIDRVGPEMATTALVAAEAGVSIGRLYYWFPDANALLRAVEQRIVEHLDARLGDALAGLGRGDVADDVHGLVTATIDAAWLHPSVLVLFTAAAAPAPDSRSVRGTVLAAVGGLVRTHRATTAETALATATLVLAEALMGGVRVLVRGGGVDVAGVERELCRALAAMLTAP